MGKRRRAATQRDRETITNPGTLAKQMFYLLDTLKDDIEESCNAATTQGLPTVRMFLRPLINLLDNYL